VPEVHPCLEELPPGDDRHGALLPVCPSARFGSPAARLVLGGLPVARSRSLLDP